MHIYVSIGQVECEALLPIRLSALSMLPLDDAARGMRERGFADCPRVSMDMFSLIKAFHAC